MSDLGNCGQLMPEKIDILGVGVSAIDMNVALDTVDEWISTGRLEFVCFRDVHGVIAAQTDPELQAAHEKAGMVAPDGLPLVPGDF